MDGIKEIGKQGKEKIFSFFSCPLFIATNLSLSLSLSLPLLSRFVVVIVDVDVAVWRRENYGSRTSWFRWAFSGVVLSHVLCAFLFVRLKKSTSLHEVLSLSLSLTEKMRAFFLLLHETNSSRASRQVFLRARARIGFWTLALSHTPRRWWCHPE